MKGGGWRLGDGVDDDEKCLLISLLCKALLCAVASRLRKKICVTNSAVDASLTQNDNPKIISVHVLFSFLPLFHLDES